MARLPTPGGDNGNWGDILNEYLSQAHKSDGTIKNDVVGAAQIADGSITETLLDSTVQTKLNTTASWTTLANKPTVVAAGATQGAARSSIGAGDVQSSDIPVNVLKEGVAGDGATNDRAAIQTVLTTYGGVRDIRFPKGRYRIGQTGVTGANRITIPSGTRIICDAGAVFEINQVDSQTGTSIFYVAGTDGTKSNMTNNTPAGSQTIALPSGQGASFAKGTLVGIESTGSPGVGTDGNPYRNREIRKVMSVSGDTLNLDAPLEYTYNTTDTAQFWKITPASDVSLEGMRFEVGPGVTPGTDQTYPIKFLKTLNCRIADVELHDMIGGIMLLDAYDTLITNVNIDGLPRFSDAFGYGLTAGASTTNLIVNGLRGRETRHLFTTVADYRSASNTYWGDPMHIQVNNAVGYGAVNGYSIFDTHEFGRHIHFNDCIAIGGGVNANGFQVRAKSVELNNCRAIRNGLRGAALTATSSNVQINGGEFANSGSSGINDSGTYNRILNAYVHHTGANGTAVGGIAFGTSSDTCIQGCTLVENNGRALEDATTAVRPVIKNVYAPKGTSQTSSLINLSATGICDGCIFTGYGALAHGLVSPTSGCKITNLVTDSGVAMNQIMFLGASSVPNPTFDSSVVRNGFQGIRADVTFRANRFSIGDPTTQPTINAGSGSPEGSLTAVVGSLYLRSGGGAGTSIYVKESGTGNTGWVAK